MTPYEKTNLILLALTALVVAWYTCETYRLRKAAQRQIVITHQPILSLEYGGHYESERDAYGSSGDDRIAIINCGFGPAFNVQLGDWANRGVKRVFRSAPMLPVNAKVPILSTYIVEDLQAGDRNCTGDSFLLAYFLSQDIENQKEPLVIKTAISYQDAQGKTYTSLYEIVFDRVNHTISTAFEKVVEGNS